jgi:cytoskeletal protein CcmA (bactofilin family)
MGSSVSQEIVENQNVTNNVLQSARNTCVNVCKTIDTNLLIDVEAGGVVEGDIGIKETCVVTGATCILKNTMDTSISSVLSSIASQKQADEAGIFAIDFGNYNQSTNINQNIRNNISQMVSNNCKNIVESEKTNPTIIISGVVKGNVLVGDDLSASGAQCLITNVESEKVTNSEKAEATQSLIHISPFMAFAVIFGLVVGLGCVAAMLKMGKKHMDQNNMAKKNKMKTSV